jgi:3-oxoacyl-(acyl-carrier-protein) reductase
MKPGTSSVTPHANDHIAALMPEAQPGRSAPGLNVHVHAERRPAQRAQASAAGESTALSLPLKGRVAVVTGSSRGIGRAIADELTRQGASCVYNCVSSIEALQRLMFERAPQAGRSIAVQADVSEPDACAKLMQKALEEFGQIDILVNNAGITRDKTLRKMSGEDWHTVIDHDLNSVFYCTRAALPHMIERGHGRIVNVSSIIAQTGNVGQANYAAAKAGMIGFTKSVAREVARHGITVNAVCPGFIETDMLGAVPEEAKQRIVSQIPLGRFGHASEVAALVRFLVAEGAWITGQQFNVNGGMYM